MEVIEAEGWVVYFDPQKAHELDSDKVGKRMTFFNDQSFAQKICSESVEFGCVPEAKHNSALEGE